MDAGVVIPAAGKGRRMGGPVSKQFLDLCGVPVLIRTLQVFLDHPAVSQTVLAVSPQEVDYVRDLLNRFRVPAGKVLVTPGGRERQDSVREGLKVLDREWVLVHDAVRPFITREQITTLLQQAEAGGAAVLAVPVKDTIKEVNSDGLVDGTPDRSRLWAVQTPQAFRRSLLVQAHEEGERTGLAATDDAMLVEALGAKVRVVEGDYSNLKLTTPEDMALAEAIWKMRSQ
ncbi:MAG: 2-C-methyl-D-erythritol 4-phosphate cytidylyltransferase [Firmicutes bacterium]|uniref:2-C-methyl-D-erythritol 4-phosphate cytidylyltransferase n=1 Tax=Melghirimyces thermohalophilus TaxID=1236220 RepID=A0A1G6PC10_9BACL|nr:2-C-methyl-D-erythritol 4-phosphate cytidylyltransferase [Melghirimyces thermohalophilus]MDA8353452.1 2-C-methyl-D-erythritol 4-phosphate cytidylyltransferase [Bacillota bacterium]SDC77548.1 2-C-methyl-D-erythritol 4-phosphate cytidylyltransferase [Melghirimyces thermohalophilus]